MAFDGGVIPRGHRWSSIADDHRLSVANTVVFCRACGKWASWKVQGMRKGCDLTAASDSADQTWVHLLEGRSPQTSRDWPGGAAASTTFAVARVTVPTALSQAR